MAHNNELYWSDETYAIFSIPKGTPMTYQRFLDAVYPDDREFVNTSWQEALKGKRYDMEHRIIANDKVKWVRETAELEFDRSELISGFGTVQDITDKKQADEQLKLSEERFHKAFNANPAAISISRVEDGLLTNVNMTYLRLFGFSRDEVLGKTSIELGIFADKGDRRKIIELLNKKGTVRNLEMTFLTKSRKPINTLISLDKINIDNIEYMISTVTDITRRKRMEKDLEQYAKNLENLVEQRTKELKDKERLAAIGETAGMVGHDIRNPLQAIVGDLYFARETTKELLDCAQKQSLEEIFVGIEDNIFYINKIVSDLQDYTRPLRPQFEEVYLLDLINSAINTACVPDNVITSVDIDRNLLVRADESYLKRVFTNLMLNAIQAMPDGGKLTVKALSTNGKITINVQDTGVGIPESIRTKLFTPLFTTKSKGQGLGLAVVKRLVEGLHGTIGVESTEGRGTKFIVTLHNIA